MTMATTDNDVRLDSTLRALGPLGRYQMTQVVLVSLSFFPSAYQLLDNIFIGRLVTSHHCTPYNSSTSSPDHGVAWNTSNVTYGKCEITVSKDDLSEQSAEYSCLYGYDYGYPSELSFRTEFDLVCDRKLLGGLVQTILIIGQGVGAVLSSICSDRFGRKKVLVISELGLFVFGVGAGFSPSYPVLAVLKFFIGAFQQGAVTSTMSMAIEFFPAERRAVASLLLEVMWASCACSMALVAFLLQHHNWKYLQLVLSAASLLAFLHWWSRENKAGNNKCNRSFLTFCYSGPSRAFINDCGIQRNGFVIIQYLDESLRWLLVNGQKESAVKVLKRAARTNNKDLTYILKTLELPTKEGEIYTIPNGNKPDKLPSDVEVTSPQPQDGQEDVLADKKVPTDPKADDHQSNDRDVAENTPKPSHDQAPHDVQRSMEGKQTRRLTILDIFRHRRLLFNAGIMWFAWFTTAFAFFALYMMSTSLHGNRFVNYFLISLMELPPGFIFYFFVDRLGRKGITRPLFAVAGAGLLSSGLLRHFAYNSALQTLSVVTAMLGMVGASGMFLAIFFYTPEMFPTNMRTQAIGISSFAGRLGGMISPFMTDLAEIAVWAPGALIGSLCFCVVIVMHFLPETKGRELPDTIEDIEDWYQHQSKSGEEKYRERYTPKSEDRF